MENLQNLMTLDLFAPHIDEVYTIDRVNEAGEPEGHIELKLVEARGKQLHANDGRRDTHPRQQPVRSDPFALLFTGPRNHFLQQGLYTLNHHSFGRHAVFLVPIGQDADGYIYEAVFN